MGKLELTLALFKPDIALNETIVSSIKQLLVANQFNIVRSKFTRMTLDQAKSFYQVHEKKFFYNRLIYFMSSGPMWCHVLAKENAIAEWRQLMGPTKVFKTIYDAPHTIRGLYGTTDTRNCCHGSDSMENAIAEIKFFFPEFNAEEWYQNHLNHPQTLTKASTISPSTSPIVTK